MVVHLLFSIAGAWLLMATAMAVLFYLRHKIGNTGVVDAAWSLGVGALAVLYALLMPGDVVSRCLLALFAVVWSLRLGLHILTDRVIGKPEDGRYRDLVAGYGNDAPRRLFRFFQYQAFFVVVFSLPFVPLAMAQSQPHSWQILAAAAVWCLAVGGEALADRQLAQWRADPVHRGHTCRQGLWRYSRHPNYFFEWVHWWTYVVLGIGIPWGWTTLLGPALMFFFLYRVTGIPYTEKQALKSRGDDYRRYQATVSPFFPWFSKEDESAGQNRP